MAFTYEIVKPIAKIGSTGELEAELNLIRFNGRAEKYDLRRWRVKDGERRMQKGITLTGEELHALRDVLNDLEDLYSNWNDSGLECHKSLLLHIPLCAFPEHKCRDIPVLLRLAPPPFQLLEFF